MAFILILVLWGFLAIVGYRACVANGYPEWAAFVGALLLGPFAPLLGLVKREGKLCAFCRSHIHQLATVCPKCTREQPGPKAAEETEAQRRKRIADRIQAQNEAEVARLREVERKHGG